MGAMTKSIVITGGSRGIGAATARLAGKRGWSVAVNYAGNEKAARETAAAVETAGGKAIVVRGDVAEESDVVRLFDAAVEAFGGIDGVVNNAGIIVAPPQSLAEMSAERIRRVVSVNFVGAYLVAREGIRRMAKSRGGRGGVIVNVSSAAARLGGPNEYVDYAGTKGAIDTLTLGLAKEVGPDGIRVAAVRPGLIETDIHASGGSPGRAERLGSTVPIGRSGTADEVGAAIVWLLSDEASYVNGAILEITGGR
jgi:NAD(P)-dependent dehydrogenase (short-subunit alcohol dehydrogenase family)